MMSNDNAEPSNAGGTGDKPQEYQQEPQQASAQARGSGSGSEPAQPQPVYHCPSSGQDKKHWLEYATFTVATLGFIAALFAAGFTFWQAWIAKDTEKRQLRAYLVMEGADLQRFGIGDKAQIEVLFENMGLTPAHDAGWMSQLEVLDYTGGPTFSHLECSVVRNAPENPKWMVGKSKQLTKYWPTAFTADEVARVQAGKAAVYFHGRLCYLDIFEEERQSDFCVYWKWENGGLTFRRCPKGYSAS